jgi:hypothetical protein
LQKGINLKKFDFSGTGYVGVIFYQIRSKSGIVVGKLLKL